MEDSHVEEEAAVEEDVQAGGEEPQAGVVGADGLAGLERAVAERDARIAELEAQVEEAARSREAAERLSAEIAALKAEGESQRVEFALTLAGCRSVKAARALLDEHGGDVDALRAAEPWLFKDAQPTGSTGLPSAGAAGDDGELRRWRRVAGLED